MKIKRENPELAEGDMTPMIDMVFQLIAFFMVLVNFSDAEQSQKINLPTSLLAKPPEQKFEKALYIQLTRNDTLIFGGQEVPLAGLGRQLVRERQLIQREGQPLSVVTVVIRADGAAKTGVVQEVIEICQQNQFEKFALRAEQKESTGSSIPN